MVVPDDVSTDELVGRLGEYDVVVVDIDNTLTADQAPGPVVAASLDEVRRTAQRCGVGRVVALSNGSPSRALPGDGVVWNAGKPLTARTAIGVAAGESAAVVGDKVLSDGVLAHRWGAVFYLKRYSPDRRPLLRRALDSVVRRALFTIETLE